MHSWIVSVGPNQGRGSSHAHGPVTDTGPVRVVPYEAYERLWLAANDALAGIREGEGEDKLLTHLEHEVNRTFDDIEKDDD